MFSSDFTVVNDWGGGFQGRFTLDNRGMDTTNGGVLTFRASFDIAQIWGGRITSRVGDLYTVEAFSWNSGIGPGQSVEIGFIGGPGGHNTGPSDVMVNGAPTSDPGDQPDPPAPLPVASIADTTVDEGDDAIISVTLTEPAAAPVVLTYETRALTAGSDDFSVTTQTITIAEGQSTGSIAVVTFDDTLDEPIERFEVVLLNATGATIGETLATVTLIDNDETPPPPPPTVPDINVNSVSVNEGNPRAASGWFSTDGSRIVDESGNEVRIAGVNWFGGETTRFGPDGLFMRNWQDMMDQMADLGFNAIRLPFSNEALRPGATPNDIDYSINQDLTGLTTLELFDKIIEYAEVLGIRIILDNHRNAAGDGASANGLWYGEGYTEAEWIADWEMLARRYADNPTVVGFDLSNEPHAASWGDGSALTDWRLGAERAIAAVHAINPDVLVMIEGIGGDYWWGGNLKGVADAPIRLSETDKLVYSPHAYPNSIFEQPWFSDPNFPENLPEIWDRNWAYIAREQIAPIYVGEFGSRLEDPKDLAWSDAFIPFMDDIGASWTFWSWNPNSGDTGGILEDDWRTPINAKLDLLRPIQSNKLFVETGDETLPREIAVTVTLSEAAPTDIEVDYATEDGTAVAGTDYEATSGTLTFAAGETERTITIDLLPNTAADGDRAFAVQLSNPTFGEFNAARATVTIIDDETIGALPVITLSDATVNEGDGIVRLVAELDSPASSEISASVSASPQSADNSDFSLLTSSVVIAPGEDRAAIDIAIVDDTAFEGSETFQVSLTNLAGATASDTTANVTIVDNDSAPPTNTDDDADGNGIFATLAADDDWGSGFVARGDIVNNSAETLTDWTFELRLQQGNIVNLWGAEIIDQRDNVYILGAVDYNTEIVAGASSGWGIQVNGALAPFTLSDVTSEMIL